MTIARNTGRVGAFLLPIALILAACGGGSASASPSGSGGTSAATATPAPTAAATASAGSEATAGSSVGGIPIPSFDLSGLVNGLEDHTSYQVTTTTGGVVSYKATVVNKPVKARDVVLSGTRVVIIGDEAWTGDVGGTLSSVPAGTATQLFALYDPTYLVRAYSAFASSTYAADKGSETKNGVNAHHYRIDSTTVVGLTPLPAGAAIDVWIADGGFIASVAVTGFGDDLTIDVTNVDDPANKVDRPS